MATRGKTKAAKTPSRPKKRAERRRESGRPGGGAGRKDEVGRSGVYPITAPRWPPGADIKTVAEWGQQGRGAAGYEEAGSSELVHTEPSTRAPRKKAFTRATAAARRRSGKATSRVLLPPPR